MIKREEIVKIGQFAKPHGIKGEISLITTFDLFENDEEPYIICELDGIFVPFFVEEYRYKSDTVVLLKLENLNSEEEVRAFSNREVYYPSENMKEVEQDSFLTWDSFVGYKLYDVERGFLGEVEAVDDTTLNVLFQITYKNETMLIPVAEELVASIEHEKRSITISVPQGLFEL